MLWKEQAAVEAKADLTEWLLLAGGHTEPMGVCRGLQGPLQCCCRALLACGAVAWPEAVAKSPCLVQPQMKKKWMAQT